MAKTVNDGLLNMTEAARLAGMSRQALGEHVDAGRIAPAVTINRLRYFSRASVQQWIKNRIKQGVTKRGPQAKKNGHKKAGK